MKLNKPLGDINVHRGSFYCTDELVEDAIAKFGEQAEVVNFAYTDYGGSLIDRAAIQILKGREDIAVWEHTYYSGMNCLCLASALNSTEYPLGIIDGLEEKYFELEEEMIEEAASDILEWNQDLNLDRELVCEWLSMNGSPLATTFDFCEHCLIEQLSPNA